MSEHGDADRDVLALLDRAAGDTPPLHLTREDVVGRGRQIVRHRRSGAAGMAVGALALAGAVWLGSGLAGGVPGPQELSAAATAWEVDEPSPVIGPEGLEYIGEVQPRTLSRSSGSSVATFVVDGVEQTVEGRSLGEGVEVYVGTRATVVVWERIAGLSTEVRPAPQDGAGRADVTVDGQELTYWATTEDGYEPEEVLFFDEDSLRGASGEVAETAELRDGRVEVTAVGLPEAELIGYLHAGDLYEVDTLTISSVDRPWWRGGGSEVMTVARLPEEAVFAREVLREGGDPVDVADARPTALVGGWSMVLFVSDRPAGALEDADLVSRIEWSSDGQTWHPQPLEMQWGEADASVVREGGVVGPGGEVTLLGETYRVATDPHGWPRLVDGDGQDFLTVSDDFGPAAGGAVMWREHWWPWSDRNYVHFAVGGQPPVGGADAQDVRKMSGPAGVVTLVAVPAGS